MERVEQFRYFGTTLTEQNFVHEKFRAHCSQGMLAVIQSRVLSANLVFKKVKIKKHGNIISPVVRYGCKTWSLTLRE